MSNKMVFSIGGSSGLAWADYLEVARTCEELGFSGFYPSDHLGEVYPGRGPSPARLDAMTVLAALSGHTRRLRLGALVMGNHFRHPVITAKIVGALDHVSNGRAELGLGASATPGEHRAHGLEYPPFQERIDRLEEALQLIKALWTQERASFQGKYYRLEGVAYEPKPVQKPYPPIIVGGQSLGVLRIAARHANDWNTTLLPIKVKADLIQKLRAVCAEVGRDFSTLSISHQLTMFLADSRAEVERFLERQVSVAKGNPHFRLHPMYGSVEEQVRDSVIVGDAEAVEAGVRRWRELGVTHLNFHTPRPWNRPMLERFAARVMPAFQRRA